MADKSNGKVTNLFSFLSETVSYIYGKFIETVGYFTVVKYGYVKGVHKIVV